MQKKIKLLTLAFFLFQFTSGYQVYSQEFSSSPQSPTVLKNGTISGEVTPTKGKKFYTTFFAAGDFFLDVKISPKENKGAVFFWQVYRNAEDAVKDRVICNGNLYLETEKKADKCSVDNKPGQVILAFGAYPNSDPVKLNFTIVLSGNWKPLTESTVQTAPAIRISQIPTAQSQELASVIRRQKINLATIPPAEKLKLTNDYLKQASLPTVNSLTSSVILTPVNPKLNDQNYLAYFKPWNVLVINDSVSFEKAASALESSLAIVFKPSAPGLYVFDLTIERIPTTNFSIYNLSDKSSQTIKIPEKKSGSGFTNLIFAMNFTDASAKTIFVYADQSWSFYKCEISQAK